VIGNNKNKKTLIGDKPNNNYLFLFVSHAKFYWFIRRCSVASTTTHLPTPSQYLRRGGGDGR
jgi:hypothetical protein